LQGNKYGCARVCSLFSCAFGGLPQNYLRRAVYSKVWFMGIDGQGTRQPSLLRTMLIGRNPKRTLVRIIILVISCLIFFRLVLLPIRVEGASMYPTYRDHRVNFVNRLSYLFHEPQRGDVVAIRTSGLSIMYMKRIVGLPGETVGFHEGHAVIDGKELEEPYLKFPSGWEHEARRLGPDEYYCVGDNRSMPQSDHTEGKAKRDHIVGKVLL